MVLNELDPIELLNLSSCSKNCTRSIKGLSKCHCAETCLLYIRNPQPSITINFRKTANNLIWIFDHEEVVTKQHIVKNKILSGYVYQTVYLADSPCEIMCRNENILECFPILLKHLLGLFSAPVHIVIEPNIGKLISLFDDPLMSVCSELEFTRGYKMSQFEDEEVENILEKIRVKKTLKLKATPHHVHSGNNKMCHKHLRNRMAMVENVTLINARFLQNRDLQDLKCRTAKFVRHQFNMDDIEKYVLKWQKNQVQPRIERLELGWFFEAPISFENLETMRWDRSRRSKRCLKADGPISDGTYDCSEAHDIIRRDGLLASIGLVELNGSNIVVFHVWHDRFPTKPHQDMLDKKLADLMNQLPDINRNNGVRGLAEDALKNPKISSTEFHDLLHQTYNHRLGLFGTSPELERWFDFHNQILNVKKDIEFYF